MVFDFRTYAPDDWISKCALVSWNEVAEGGTRIFAISRRAKRVLENQRTLVALVQSADEVNGDQGGVLVGVNYAREVKGDQVGIFNILRDLKELKFLSSTSNRQRRAREYLDRMSKKIERVRYEILLETLAERKTRGKSYRDLLTIEARRRIPTYTESSSRT
jgi:hypothetical protein